MENHQSSYYSLSYRLTALKICHYTVHKKVGEQHITHYSLMACNGTPKLCTIL